MSDTIHEECGLALIRLRKPLTHYQEKYGTALWGFHKLFLLMEKQHNRGQDGAGVGALKLNMKPGEPYFFRMREYRSNPLDRIFKKLNTRFAEIKDGGKIEPGNAESVKKHFEFGAELYIGHLRYGTFGGYNVSSCHPCFRRSNWPTKNLMLAGNFNLTNTPSLNAALIGRGQHPIFYTDTQTLLEEIGFHLDEEHDELYKKSRISCLDGPAIAEKISAQLDPARVLRRAAENWDGGYAIVGLIGNGDSFAFRDPFGIRPLYYFEHQEAFGFASERGPLMTVFNLKKADIKEVTPGSAVVIKKDGSLEEEQIIRSRTVKHCSFERIYFSRGNDPDIYQERKAMGAALSKQILKAVDNDLNRTVLSFIPNTAEMAYYGLINRIKKLQYQNIKKSVLEAQKQGKLDKKFMDGLLKENWVNTEKVAIKDIKLRTFISQDKGRDELASHVYDVSYGSVSPRDNLVCIDDSIVRGTTLKQSIIKILARLNPRKIIIASTAPQIRYPDCYGIDMSQLHRFIAFQAAVALVKEKGKAELLEEVYINCQKQAYKPIKQIKNYVKKIYDCSSTRELSAKIAELVTPKLDYWSGEVQIIYQTVEDLHKSLKTECGDWYFTGNYPTPGGYKVLNTAYLNYFEERAGRSY
ncbi:amidophosphoribosyltransferase [Fibrobacterota bacterium]